MAKNKTTPNAIKYLFTILIITSLACATPSLLAPEQSVDNTQTSQPVITEILSATSLPTYTFTPTLIRPTREATQTFTPTVFVTLDPNTATVTDTALPTSTVELITMTVSRPTNCRVGPGKAYEIAGTLLAGEKAIVLGRDPSNQYWYIANPDPGVEFCWVWGEYATFTGNNLLVPAYTPIATYTATPTALPDIKFDVQSRGADKCNGDFWIKLEITNTSQQTKLPFRSIRIEVEDTNTNTTRFNSSDGFILRNGCNGYSQTESLDYGKSFVVSGPNFSNNLNGHTLRVYVTVCTEKDLKGICRTIKIGVKP